MRKLPALISLVFILSSFTSMEPTEYVPDQHSSPANVLINRKPPSPERLASMKIKEVQKLIGRKLSLKETIAFKMAQHKIKKQLKAKKNEKTPRGKTAFILGLIGLILLFIPYAAIASLPLAIIAIVQGNQALKENPKDTKARTGMILGWVTLGLFILFLLIALILIAAFTGSWFG